jgi:hypothetical protein
MLKKQSSKSSKSDLICRWLNIVVINWLKKIIAKEIDVPYSVDDIKRANLYKNWKKNLKMYLLQTFGKMRFEEMIEIIQIPNAEESLCLADIKYCLEKTQQVLHFNLKDLTLNSTKNSQNH